jgi:hypothetical protein
MPGPRLAHALRVLRPVPTVEPRTTSAGFVPHSLADADIEHYRENGWVLTPPLVSPAGLQRIRGDAMRAWEQEKGGADQGASELTWLQAALLPNVHRLAPACKEYYWTGPHLDLVRQLIGPNVKTSGTQLSFKMRGNLQEFDWHQDNQYGYLSPMNAVTVILALDDTTLDNGAIWVASVPGAGTLAGQRPADWSPLREGVTRDRVINDDTEVKNGAPVPMQAGQIMLLHAHTLHRSVGNHTEGDRRLLFCRYCDADAVEVYNNNAVRVGRLLSGVSSYPEVHAEGDDWKTTD